MSVFVLCAPDEVQAANRLADAAGLPLISYQLHHFPDAELKLTLPFAEAVPRELVLYRSLDKPNDKLVELLLIARQSYPLLSPAPPRVTWVARLLEPQGDIPYGVAIAIELPQKVTVEVVETEPVVKGQTASSSYKPAVAHNGVRIMVPPHIGVGTKVIINTADLTYVERAKA